jgi:hypothetical protein
MKHSRKNQIALLLDTNDPETVIHEVETIFFYYYKPQSFDKIENVFKNICDLFSGTFPGYRKCNTEYHNLKHTLDAFLATSRLIDGRNLALDIYPERKAVNLLIAALLHDTGYIQEDSDTEGTGAKYTKIHVKRSIEFAKRNAKIFRLTRNDFHEVKNFISCTGLKADNVTGLSGDELTGGCILGTADLIGQMSDRAYLEKLLFLYYEFSEAGLEGFNTSFDILRKTFIFYESTMDRLNETLMKNYEFARYHFKKRFGINENLYIAAMEKQMDYLKFIIDDENTNFRNKLKRMNIEEMEQKYKMQAH